MRRFYNQILDRVAWRVGSHLLGMQGDVMNAAATIAAFESAKYWEERMRLARKFNGTWDLLSFTMTEAPLDGLTMEFGVASGRSLNCIARAKAPRAVYGFDGFTRLPEAWRPDFDQGAFAQPSLPKVEANEQLVAGLFGDTLSRFLGEHAGPARFIRIDCDLYRSTASVLEKLDRRKQPGAAFVFDEYFSYLGWKHHEFKAWQEYTEANNLRYRCLGFFASHQQAAVIVE